MANDNVQTAPAGSVDRPGAINPKLVEAIEVNLDAYLGGTRMTVAELSAMKGGSVIALDAALNSAVELRLNGIPVARGELVAVGDNFAIRLTEIAA